jgi:hypothetical protein
MRDCIAVQLRKADVEEHHLGSEFARHGVQSVGISESEWTARRDVLEQPLVRPLRSYCNELLPAYLSEMKRTNSPLASQIRRGAN